MSRKTSTTTRGGTVEAAEHIVEGPILEQNDDNVIQRRVHLAFVQVPTSSPP
jgi:hypothetical protein